MDAVLQLMPEEERISYSAMTGQSLFYMGETNLGHKILAIAEEKGAERASYALKLLQSEGELTIASTGKDPTTGRLVTEEYHVQGPVMIFLTTTAIEVDEELMNRCLVLSVDENREQTHAIHDRQRMARTLEGLLQSQEKMRLERLHQNAQRLLRPLHVVNSFAAQLTFPDHQTRLRRDHMKYLSLIDTVALVHQHQRPVKTVQNRGRALEYIEVSPEDIAIANHLCAEVLGRTLDELPPQTRRLLDILHELATEECERRGVDVSDLRITRRAVRERTGWSATQLRVHLGRLVEMEYLLPHRGKRGQSFEYELMYAGEGRDGSRFLHGLLSLPEGTTATWRGSWGDLAPPKRAQNAHKAGPERGGVSEVLQQKTSDERNQRKAPVRNARLGKQKLSSQSHASSLLVASAGAPGAAE